MKRRSFFGTILATIATQAVAVSQPVAVAAAVKTPAQALAEIDVAWRGYHTHSIWPYKPGGEIEPGAFVHPHHIRGQRWS